MRKSKIHTWIARVMLRAEIWLSVRCKSIRVFNYTLFINEKRPFRTEWRDVVSSLPAICRTNIPKRFPLLSNKFWIAPSVVLYQITKEQSEKHLCNLTWKWITFHVDIQSSIRYVCMCNDVESATNSIPERK